MAHERVAGLDALIQDQIPVCRLARRHALGLFRLAHYLGFIHEHVKMRIRLLDRGDRERVILFWRCVQNALNPVVMACDRVINQHRQQVGISRRLRTDHDR